ncbi:hypothetical protein [Nocardiopsis baichengensis]|uniref:hypothetical protein n=1 Tax=Nocardiopsis baichengensis TaxID=280240 RepID=UPI00034CBF0B|nr:hypothetical protein [Nocardiopsis baichengensis]
MAAPRLLALLTALAVTALAVLGAVRSHSPSPLERTPEEVAADAAPRLAFLRSALRDGAGADMQALFPEGYFFTHALYGLARADTGTLDARLRDEALWEARWALDRLESPEGTAAFPAGAEPAYGVFHAGWSTYLRVRIVELAGGPDAAPEEAGRLAEDTAELRSAFSASLDRGTPYLEAYPGQAWPVDSVVAAAALARDARVRGTDGHDSLLAAWKEAAAAHTDPATGLIPHRADAATGAPAEGARGSSQALLLRFLPDIDPAWAARDRAAFQEAFASPVAPLPGVREHPHGDDSPGDVDSGPLVLGLSASASTVALGDAVVYGDTASAAALTGFAEALGLPVAAGGERRYLGGALPVGDAFLVWSLTAQGTHPDPLPPPDGASPSAHAPPAWWRAPWYALAGLVTAAAWWVAWMAAHPRRSRNPGDGGR